jgi:hypothetical protein
MSISVETTIRSQHEMDTRVGHEVGLELSDVHVQGAVETQRGCQRRDNLRDQPVQVGVRRTLDVQVAAADVIQGLVVNLVRHVSVLQQGVDAQHTVVGLDNGSRHLWAGPHGEGDLGLLPVVDGEPLQHQAPQTRSRTTTDSMVDHEALETSAVVRELTDAVQAQIDNLLTNGVVPASEVVGGVLLTLQYNFRTLLDWNIFFITVSIYLKLIRLISNKSKL